MGLKEKFINKHTLSLASNAVMPVVGMVTVSMLARSLSESDFGDWIFFLITFTLANFFRSGFLQTSLVKFYSGATTETARTIAGSTWVLAIAITILLGLFSFIVFIFYQGDASSAVTIKWFAIIFFSTLPSSVALWILQAEEQFGKVFFLQLTGQGCFFLLVIISLLVHKVHFQDIIHVYCVSAIITSSVALISGWAKIRTITSKTWQSVKQIMHFGKYSVASSISSYLLRGSDTFIIKYMFVDPAVVGIYYLPQRLMEIIEIPLRSFIATALPAMSSAIRHDDKIQATYIMKKYAGILTILLIPVTIVACLFAGVIIDLLGGDKFNNSDAPNVFRIFMSFAILLPVDRFFGISLDMLNLPKHNMIKIILMLIVNVAGDFAGIAIFHNLYGVALSSILTFLAGVLYGYIILKKHLKFTIRDVFKIGYDEIRSIVTGILIKLKGTHALK